MEFSRVISVIGFIVILLMAWILSNNRKVVNWRVIIWGVVLEILFASFIFILPIGTQFFMFVNDVVNGVLDSATFGIRFLFGRLGLSPGSVSETGETSIGFILALQAFPTIIFFASLVGVLYYLGIMQKIIKGFSFLFTKLMGISGAESLSASSNIFVGVESGLVIKPFLKSMTRSEICTVLTAGMATIASSMLAVYIMMLKTDFPSIAGHLVSASIMNAPAAIIISKLLYPETETPETMGKHVKPHYEKEDSLFEAVINNANSGVKIIVGIAALLLAVLGLMTLVDKIIVLFGSQLNYLLSTNIDWTLKGLLGYLFYPVTLVIGIPFSEAVEISKIIGERLILTEVVSFQDLAALTQSGSISPRSVVITTYALTGFASVASMAIFVGGFSAIAPERLKDISRLGFKALLGATMATLLTASLSGVFYTSSSIMMGQ
ncbi:MAG: nucleoside transporter [Bacteroidetes bacterium]|nr:nucleoside transporter [Bacteroidota bacterium]